jgi:hypothetical protein
MAFVLASLLLAVAQGMIQKDVCVLGGGASGMATAAFVKDNGYDVVVLEKRNTYGGHCNTITFPPLVPGAPTWADYGVQLFPDTRRARERNHVYNFTINTTDFVERFAGNGSVLPFSFSSTTPRYIVDLDIQGSGFPAVIDITNASVPNQIFTELGILVATVATLYPWISSPGSFPNTASSGAGFAPTIPDPIPADLLQPFGSWLVNHNLGDPALAEFLSQLTDNLGDPRQVLALYVLPIISPLVLSFFSDPQASFEVKNGCVAIYNGINAYLGSENVLLNSTIQSVARHGNSPAQISVINSYNNRTSKFHCDNVVVAFPQTLTNLNSSVWDLDVTETAIFSQTAVREYVWGSAIITGPTIPNGTGFNVQFRNTSDQFFTAPYPGLVQILRDDQVPVAAWYAVSNVGASQVDTATLLMIAGNEAGLLQHVGPLTQAGGPPLFSSVTFTGQHPHQYQPFVTNVTALATSPNFYTQVYNLQGYRGTYYVGATTGYSASFVVWENAYKLVQMYFPPPSHGHGK